MLVDVMSLGVTGKDAEHLLDEIGITVNKNQIPFDGQPANTSSGSASGRRRSRRVAWDRTRCARSAG